MADCSYRLAAFDVDGTLKPRSGPITPRVRAAVAAAIAAGVQVTLATGRMYRAARPFVEELGITAPVICYGGAVVRHPVTDETLFEQSIDETLVRCVVSAGRARGLGVSAYVGDQLFIERLPVGSALAAYAQRAEAILVSDLLEVLPAAPCHLALVSDESGTRGLVQELRDEFGGSLAVTSGHPLLAEIDHPEVSKGKALALVAEHLGVPRASVLAAGDDWNDVAMLEYAGLGAAMADAQPELIAVADVVAPTAAEDGVAWLIERYLLGPAEDTERR